MNAKKENRTRGSSKTETEENVLLENRKLGCQSPQWAAWDDSRADTRVLVPVPDNKNILGTPEKGPGWGRSVFMVQVWGKQWQAAECTSVCQGLKNPTLSQGSFTAMPFFSLPCSSRVLFLTRYRPHCKAGANSQGQLSGSVHGEAADLADLEAPQEGYLE